MIYDLPLQVSPSPWWLEEKKKSQISPSPLVNTPIFFSANVFPVLYYNHGNFIVNKIATEKICIAEINYHSAVTRAITFCPISPTRRDKSRLRFLRIVQIEQL